MANPRLTEGGDSVYSETREGFTSQNHVFQVGIRDGAVFLSERGERSVSIWNRNGVEVKIIL